MVRNSNHGQQSGRGSNRQVVSLERLLVAGMTLAALVLVAACVAIYQVASRYHATADEALRDHASYNALSIMANYRRRIPGAVFDLSTGAEFNQPAVNGDTANTGPIELTPRPRFSFVGEIGRWDGAGLDTVFVRRLDSLAASSVDLEGFYRSLIHVHGVDTFVVFITPRASLGAWQGFALGLPEFRRDVLGPHPRQLVDDFARRYRSRSGVHDSASADGIRVGVRGPGGVPLLSVGHEGRAGRRWRAASPMSAAFAGEIEFVIGEGGARLLLPYGLPPHPLLPTLLAAVVGAIVLGSVAVLQWRAFALARARAEFTSAVSHELRTPLANIHLFAETLLLERIADHARREQALRTIADEARRLEGIVENVLTSARMGRAGEELRPQPEDVEAAAREVVNVFRLVLEQREMSAEVVARGGAIGMVDGAALRRILVNLLDNAIRHAAACRRVTIEVAVMDDVVHVAVQDDGPGFAPDTREQVWDAFARGAQGGSGLGLWVVRHLARAHGGDAVIAPSPRGARIEVTLRNGGPRT